MLTKEQASAMADKLLAEGKSARTSTRKGRATRLDVIRVIPTRYGSDALRALPAPVQLALLARARSTAVRTRQGIGLLLSSAALLALLVVPLWSTRSRGIFWLALIGIVVVGVQIRILLVRTRLQELLLEAGNDRQNAVAVEIRRGRSDS